MTTRSSNQAGKLRAVGERRSPGLHASARRIVRGSGIVLAREKLGVTGGKRSLSGAFSLIEMLLVIGVILLLSALTLPALQSISSASALNKGVYELSQILEGSRTYAMARHTYVWIGFWNLTNNGACQLQTIALASLDGTTTNTPGNLTRIFRSSRVDNLCLTNCPPQPYPTVSDPVTFQPVLSGVLYSPEGVLLTDGSVGSNTCLQLIPTHGLKPMPPNTGATIAVEALTGRQCVTRP